MKKQTINVLSFEECAVQAAKFAQRLGVTNKLVKIHLFPDAESLVTLPTDLAEHVVFYRSLNQPNSKLIELLFAARTARKFGAKRLSLIAPYLCYMRQDIENNPGEAISQQIIGQFLAELFDDVITVDSHLHRISHLDQVIVNQNAINILATEPISQFIAGKFETGFIFGPDSESEQWVKQVANKIGFNYAVANKVRSGDQDVKITLVNANILNQDVIILDDIASTGRTIAETAKLLSEAGAGSIYALITHALFASDSKNYLLNNYVREIWSTDSISDDTNAIELNEIIAEAFNNII